MAKKKYRIYKAGGAQGKVVNPMAKFLGKANEGMIVPTAVPKSKATDPKVAAEQEAIARRLQFYKLKEQDPSMAWKEEFIRLNPPVTRSMQEGGQPMSEEEMMMMQQQAMQQQQAQPQMSQQEMMMQQEQEMQMLMELIEQYAQLTQSDPEEIFQLFQETQDPNQQQAMIDQMLETIEKANAGSQEMVEEEVQPMSKGGYVKKRVKQLKKAQEGMENEQELEASPTINDIPDGREALVSGFNQSLKDSAQTAVFKEQAQEEFDSGNYQFGGGKERRKQRRTNRRLRRAFKDIPMAYGINQFGVPSSGVNVFAPAMMQLPSQQEVIKSENAENSEVTNESNPQGINIKGNMKYGLFGRPKRYEFEMTGAPGAFAGLPGAFTPFMGGMFGTGAMGTSTVSQPSISWQDPVSVLVKQSNKENVRTNSDEEQEMRNDPLQPSSDADIKEKIDAEKRSTLAAFTDPYTTADGETIMTNPNAPNYVSNEGAPELVPYTREDGSTIMINPNAANRVSMEDGVMTKEKFDELPMLQQLETMEHQLRSNRMVKNREKVYGEKLQYGTGDTKFRDYFDDGREIVDLNRMPEDYEINWNASWGHQHDANKPETYIYKMHNPPENYSEYISNMKRHRDWLRTNKVDRYNDGESMQLRHKDGEYKGQIYKDNAPDLAKHRVMDYKIEQFENATKEEKEALQAKWSESVKTISDKYDKTSEQQNKQVKDLLSLVKGNKELEDKLVQDEIDFKLGTTGYYSVYDQNKPDEEYGGTGEWLTEDEMLNMSVQEHNEMRYQNTIERIKSDMEYLQGSKAERQGLDVPDFEYTNDEEFMTKVTKYLRSLKETNDDRYNWNNDLKYYTKDESGLSPDFNKTLLERYENYIKEKRIKEYYEQLSESEKAAYDEKIYNRIKIQKERKATKGDAYDKEWDRYKAMTEAETEYDDFAPDFERTYGKSRDYNKMGGIVKAQNGQEVEEDPFAQAVSTESQNPLLSDMFMQPGETSEIYDEEGNYTPTSYQFDPKDIFFDEYKKDKSKSLWDGTVDIVREAVKQEQMNRTSKTLDDFNDEDLGDEVQFTMDDIQAISDAVDEQARQYASQDTIAAAMYNDMGASAVIQESPEFVDSLDTPEMAMVAMNLVDSSAVLQEAMIAMAISNGTMDSTEAQQALTLLNVPQQTQDTILYNNKDYIDNYINNAEFRARVKKEVRGPIPIMDLVIALGLTTAAGIGAYRWYKNKGNKLPKGAKLSDFDLYNQKRLPGGQPVTTPRFTPNRKLLMSPQPNSPKVWINPANQIKGSKVSPKKYLIDPKVVRPKGPQRPNIRFGPISRGLGALGFGLGLYDMYNRYQQLEQDGGYIDRTNPDLYRFTGGGEDFMEYGGYLMRAQDGVSGIKNPDGPMPGFTWEEWEELSQEEQKQAIQGSRDARNQYATQRQQVQQPINQTGFNPFAAFTGALTGMPYGMGNSRQKLFENKGGYWKQTGFPAGTIDPSNITRIHTEGKRGLFGPKGKMDIYFGGSGEAAADGVPAQSADGRGGFGFSFEDRAQRAIDRKARRDARPGERQARQDNRLLNKQERQHERNRRRNIMQGKGDTGAFDKESASAKLQKQRDAVAQTQSSTQQPSGNQVGYSADKLDRFKSGEMGRRDLRKMDFNRAERRQYKEGDVEGASEARKNRRRAARKQYGGYYMEGGEYDLSMDEILEIMQAGGQIEFI